MTTPLRRMSAMARETAESAATVRRLLAGRDAIADIARALDAARAPLAVICGRGSSGHVGVYLRYLIETRLGLPVSATAPSVTTALHRPLKLDGALFIVISQSGASPDLVAATQAARDGGARVVAIVNNADSAVATRGAVMCCRCWQVRSSRSPRPNPLSPRWQLVQCSWAQSQTTRNWPLRCNGCRIALMRRSNSIGPSSWCCLAEASCAFVTGRGFGLGPAREIALKLAETLRMPALGYQRRRIAAWTARCGVGCYSGAGAAVQRQDRRSRRHTGE